MKISIINTLPIPSGEASVNRILSYSKELVKLGNHVTILSSGKNLTEPTGQIEGVQYQCFGHKGLMRSLLLILSNVRNGHFDAVILVSNSLLLIYPLALVCKLTHTKLYQEKSEFPFVLRKNSLLGRAFASFYVNTTYKLFDGLIVMTKPLMNYFKDKIRKDARLFEMPMTVDADRFNIEKQESKFGKYIAYCGNMAGNKDGVLNLIGSFDIASKRINDINLLLIGGSSNPLDLEDIKKFANKKNNDRVIFYGKADRDEIPALLKNASALALARPSSLQSTGGFPTKLGEYLSTGNPVIVTKVGDIPNYLNSSNSFIVEPDDNKAFAEAIISVFDDYEKAKAIGEEGQILSQTTFSAKYQSERLNKFLSEQI